MPLLNLASHAVKSQTIFGAALFLYFPKKSRKHFNSAHFPQVFGEVGSRSMQRLQVIQMNQIDENGKEQQNIGMLIQ